MSLTDITALIIKYVGTLYLISLAVLKLRLAELTKQTFQLAKWQPLVQRHHFVSSVFSCLGCVAIAEQKETRDIRPFLNSKRQRDWCATTPNILMSNGILSVC